MRIITTSSDGQDDGLFRRPFFWMDFVGTSSHLAGLRSPTGHHGPEPGSVAVRPLSTQWLSDERIAEARRVWSKAYGRVISTDEAIEILSNVRRLAEILLRSQEERQENERRHLGAGIVS